MRWRKDRRREIKGKSEWEEHREKRREKEGAKEEKKSEGKQSISSHARPWTR